METELDNFWATFPFLVVHDVDMVLDNYRVQADQSAPLIVGDRSRSPPCATSKLSQALLRAERARGEFQTLFAEKIWKNVSFKIYHLYLEYQAPLFWTKTYFKTDVCLHSEEN